MRLLSSLSTLICSLCVVAPALAQVYPNTENFGGEIDQDAEWYAICMRAERAAPAPPTPAAKACDASAAYYRKLDQANVGTAEWGTVRSCALASNDTAVLSMLYANGLGVPRNIETAIYYACSTGAAPAEMEGRVMHLSNLPHLSTLTRYDQCDDITSGAMGAACAEIAATRAGRVKTAYFAKLRATLRPNQTAAFDRLVDANRVFAKTHAEKETLRGGSGYAGFVLDAESRETEWLREYLTGLEAGRISMPPPTQFAADDAELNRVYAQRIKPAAKPDEFDITPADIRLTQRSWLAYRDAWVAFAALRYPRVPADSLKSLLTQWRIKQL